MIAGFSGRMFSSTVSSLFNLKNVTGYNLHNYKSKREQLDNIREEKETRKFQSTTVNILNEFESTLVRYINDDVGIGLVNVWSKPTFPRKRVATVQNSMKVHEVKREKIDGFWYSKIKTESVSGWLMSDWLKI